MKLSKVCQLTFLSSMACVLILGTACSNKPSKSNEGGNNFEAMRLDEARRAAEAAEKRAHELRQEKPSSPSDSSKP